LELLTDACRQSLDRYRTSVEQDDELLAGGRLSSRQRNAVMVRRGEKVVLKRYLALAEAAIPLLADKRSDLAAYKNADHAMAGYFAQLAQHLGPTGSSTQT
jgi:hypothetical protein